MKHSRILPLLAALALTTAANAQTVLSDFSDIAGDGAAFLDTWNGGTPTSDQFVQNVGSISIQPVNGGNPTGQGIFEVARGLDLTGFAAIEVTAREDAGNSVGVFSVIFFSDDGFGGQGGEQVFTFTSSDFAGSFASQSISLSSPSFTDPSFDPTTITYWAIEGNYSEPTDDFRVSFDHLQLTPVPEPGVVALLALGGGALCWRRWRRQS